MGHGSKIQKLVILQSTGICLKEWQCSWCAQLQPAGPQLYIYFLQQCSSVPFLTFMILSFYHVYWTDDQRMCNCKLQRNSGEFEFGEVNPESIRRCRAWFCFHYCWSCPIELPAHRNEEEGSKEIKDRAHDSAKPSQYRVIKGNLDIFSPQPRLNRLPEVLQIEEKWVDCAIMRESSDRLNLLEGEQPWTSPWPWPKWTRQAPCSSACLISFLFQLAPSPLTNYCYAIQAKIVWICVRLMALLRVSFLLDLNWFL